MAAPGAGRVAAPGAGAGIRKKFQVAQLGPGAERPDLHLGVPLAQTDDHTLASQAAHPHCVAQTQWPIWRRLGHRLTAGGRLHDGFQFFGLLLDRLNFRQGFAGASQLSPQLSDLLASPSNSA